MLFRTHKLQTEIIGLKHHIKNRAYVFNENITFLVQRQISSTNTFILMNELTNSATIFFLDFF